MYFASCGVCVCVFYFTSSSVFVHVASYLVWCGLVLCGVVWSGLVCSGLLWSGGGTTVEHGPAVGGVCGRRPSKVHSRHHWPPPPYQGPVSRRQTGLYKPVSLVSWTSQSRHAHRARTSQSCLHAPFNETRQCGGNVGWTDFGQAVCITWHALCWNLYTYYNMNHMIERHNGRCVWVNGHRQVQSIAGSVMLYGVDRILQWNLRIMDTFGTSHFVLYREIVLSLEVAKCVLCFSYCKHLGEVPLKIGELLQPHKQCTPQTLLNLLYTFVCCGVQVAVKAFRTALLCSNNPRELFTQQSSPAMSSKRKFPISLSVDRVSSDLMNPSPRPSPPLNRRANGTVPTNMGAPVVNGFDKVRGSECVCVSVCVWVCVCVWGEGGGGGRDGGESERKAGGGHAHSVWEEGTMI